MWGSGDIVRSEGAIKLGVGKKKVLEKGVLNGKVWGVQGGQKRKVWVFFGGEGGSDGG